MDSGKRDRREKSTGHSTETPKRRKQRGLGNWTRTMLACNTCRRMKIRVDRSRLQILTFSATTKDHVTTARECRMSASHLRLHPKGRGIVKLNWAKESGMASEEPTRKRIQLIERRLQSQEPLLGMQDEVSAALSRVESLLGITLPQPGSKDSNTSINTSDPSTSPSPTYARGGSQHSHTSNRPTLFSEANYKRWGAQSAPGQACTGVIDPSTVMTLDNTYRSKVPEHTRYCWSSRSR
jgi:hypothetical protein